MTKSVRLTKKDIDAIDSAMDELSSILEAADDADYEKHSKARQKVLQNIIKKYYSK